MHALGPNPRLLAALTAALLLAATPPVRAEEPIVIVLSLDGVRHDAISPGQFPAFDRMARSGARADRLVPPFPSNTFPAHATLATGTHPDRHGILGNRFVDPQRGLFDYENDASWFEAEPLWAAAERQGARAATFFWVGSETDWEGTGATLRVTPFDSGVPESTKVDQILAWLDLPDTERPQLVMSWWHGVDATSHRKGPGEPAVAKQLAAQDAQLGRLLSGLDERGLWNAVTLVVVSDHGMAQGGQGIDARGALEAAGIAGRVIPGGGMAHIYLDDPAAADAAAAALGRLPGVTAYTRATLPERLRARHRRAGDVVALADPPRAFPGGRGLLARAAAWFGGPPGVHGHDPETPEVQGIFFALGRGVAPDTQLGTVHAVDVAPTVAQLLAIDPPRDAEGHPRLGTTLP